MKDFLTKFILAYPSIPPHALWRAIEAKLLSNLVFDFPVLDLGCGDGVFAKVVFGNAIGEIYGCDISEKVVSNAKSQGVYKSVVVADVRYLPYSSCSFNTVVSNCVLEHIFEDEKVLKEVSRVLKKGGSFIFTVPSEKFIKNLKVQDRIYIENLNKILEHFHYRSPEEWKKILEKNGLFLEQFRYYLPKSVQQVWEGYFRIFTKKIVGRELYSFLGSRKIGLRFITRLIFPIVFKRLLRKQYVMGTTDDGEGGALLIVARRVEDIL